jgi:hypothetical protein
MCFNATKELLILIEFFEYKQDQPINIRGEDEETGREFNRSPDIEEWGTPPLSISTNEEEEF